MAIKLQLTDPDLAVYRPWVWLKFGELDFAINHPNSVDGKFRWMKDFRWSINKANNGSSVEFTIFEDRAGWNYIWPGVALSEINSTNKTALFQWGWAGRGDEVGKNISPFSNSDETSIPFAYMRNENTSGIHELIINKLDVEYAEGGINYRFSGTDIFALAQYQVGSGANIDVTFKEAVFSLMSKMEQSNGIEQGYAERTASEGFTEDFINEFDTNQKRRWPENGFPLLMTLQKWTSQLRPKKNEVRSDGKKVVPLIVPDTTAGKTKMVFTTSYIESSEPLFEIHVNPPDSSGPLGVGKHTAVNIRPEMVGDRIMAMFPMTVRQGKLYREVQHNEGAGPKMDKSNQGQPAEVASTDVGDPLTGNQATQAMQGLAALGGSGSLFSAISLEVEILGMPSFDKIEYMSEYIKLIMWNTAYIDDDLKWKREARIPGSFLGGPDTQPGLNPIFAENAGLYDPKLTGIYNIGGMGHSMTADGSYTTTIKLIPFDAKFGNDEEEEA